MLIDVSLADLSEPGVVRLLEAHAAHCTAASPPGSCHFLTASGLDSPEITLWAARDGAEVIGVGALRALPDGAGEIKSMHTLAAKRGLGIGQALLTGIEREALRRGYPSLSLETGTMTEFDAARALYERNGFTTCPPFGDYAEDPHSICYTKALTQAEASR